MARAQFLRFSVMVAGALLLVGPEELTRAEQLSIEVQEDVTTSPESAGGEILRAASAPIRQRVDRRLAQEQGPVRKALEEALGKLADLTPEQQRLFKEEVLPRARAFVTHVHAGAEGKVRVDVDLAAVRSYLALKAAGQVAGAKSAQKLGVVLQANASCAACVASEKSVLQAFQGRMKRRGFEVESLDQEADPSVLTAALLREKMAEANAQGAVGVRLARKGLDSVDTAHLEDQGYLIELLWSFPGAVAPVEVIEKFETLPGEGILDGVDRGMTATLIRLGTLASQIQLSSVGSVTQRKTRPELRLRLEGFRNYSDFLQIRSQLQSWATGELQVRERRFDAGKVWFAVTLALMQPGEEISDPAALGEAILEKFRKKILKLGNPTGIEASWDSGASELLLTAHAIEETTLEQSNSPDGAQSETDSAPKVSSGSTPKKGGAR